MTWKHDESTPMLLSTIIYFQYLRGWGVCTFFPAIALSSPRLSPMPLPVVTSNRNIILANRAISQHTNAPIIPIHFATHQAWHEKRTCFTPALPFYRLWMQHTDNQHLTPKVYDPIRVMLTIVMFIWNVFGVMMAQSLDALAQIPLHPERSPNPSRMEGNSHETCQRTLRTLKDTA